MERRGSEGEISAVLSQTIVKLLYFERHVNLKKRCTEPEGKAQIDITFFSSMPKYRNIFFSELMKEMHLKSVFSQQGLQSIDISKGILNRHICTEKHLLRLLPRLFYAEYHCLDCFMQPKK